MHVFCNLLLIIFSLHTNNYLFLYAFIYLYLHLHGCICISIDLTVFLQDLLVCQYICFLGFFLFPLYLLSLLDDCVNFSAFFYFPTLHVMCTYHILTHSFPVHPLSTPWKYKITLQFSDVFRGYRKGALETNRFNIISDKPRFPRTLENLENLKK